MSGSKSEFRTSDESQQMTRNVADLYLILINDQRGTTLVDGHLHRRLGHGRGERSRDVVHPCNFREWFNVWDNLENQPA